MHPPGSSNRPSAGQKVSSSSKGDGASATRDSREPKRQISARARLGGGRESGYRRSPAALLAAIGIHVVVILALVQWLTFGYGVPWLHTPKGEKEKAERVTFVETPQQTAQLPERIVPAPVVPQNPSFVTPAPSRPANPEVKPGSPPPAPADTGRGAPPGRGVGMPDPAVRGVQPSYLDGRVWRGMDGSDVTGSLGGAAGGRGDRADGLDSIMANALMSARDSVDSLARAQGRAGRAPGDWTTTDKSGNKWGWDQQGIRLGKVMIPNALLSLLPLNAATAANMSGNMSRLDADRRLAASRADIQRMSERTMGEAEFKRVISEMDKRRDTERRERLRAPSASIAAPVKTPPPPSKGTDR